MKPKKTKSITHTVRARNGKLVQLKLSRVLAMKIHCTECMGFESDPMDCTAKLCALYPWRRRTQSTINGTIDQAKWKRENGIW